MTDPSRRWRNLCIGLIVGVAAFTLFERGRSRPAGGSPWASVAAPVPAVEQDPVQDDPKLDTVFKDLDLQKVPLAEVLNFLSDIARVNIVVDWAAFENVGIQREMPVTIKASKITLRMLLDETARQASDNRPAVGWVSDQGSIHFSLQDILNKRDVVVKVYNVVPVLQMLEKRVAAAPPSTQPVSSGNQNQQQTGPPTSASADAVQMLISMIESTVRSDTWRDNGGDVGSLSYWGGCLIVTQNPIAQQEIARLLVTLEKAAP